MLSLRWLSASCCLLAGISVTSAQDAPESTTSSIAFDSVAAQAPASCSVCDSFCQSRFDSLWNRPTLTGDWNGLRPRLQEQGITIGGNITQFGFGLGGGIDRPVPPPFAGQGDVFSYTGRGEYQALVDLEKFGGMPQGKLLVGLQHWWGEFGNVSLRTGAFAPAIFPAALPPVPDREGIPMLTDFIVTQPLSKELVLFAGKKNVIGAVDQDDFAGGNGIAQFMNQALIANPAFLLALPYSAMQFGAVLPREWGAITVFAMDPQDQTREFLRVDDLFSKGIILGGELKVKTNFFSLPGEQHLGGLWKNVEMTDLQFNFPPPGDYPEKPVPGFATRWGSYTIYYGFDQYLQVYSEETKRGWGLFGRASISDANPTPIHYFFSLGIGGYSPFGQCRGDSFGIGGFYVGASDEFGPIPRALLGPRDGMGLEVFYNFQLTPAVNLTPDFQVLRPGTSIADTSYIAGLRLNIKF